MVQLAVGDWRAQGSCAQWIGVPCLTTSRKYQQFVRKCTQWAVETDTAEARKSFLALAKDWTFAALAADRVEKQEAVSVGGLLR